MRRRRRKVQFWDSRFQFNEDQQAIPFEESLLFQQLQVSSRCKGCGCEVSKPIARQLSVNDRVLFGSSTIRIQSFADGVDDGPMKAYLGGMPQKNKEPLDPRLTQNPFRHPLIKRASGVSGWRKVLPLLKCRRIRMDLKLEDMRRKLDEDRSKPTFTPAELLEREKLLIYAEHIFDARMRGELVCLGDLPSLPPVAAQAQS